MKSRGSRVRWLGIAIALVVIVLFVRGQLLPPDLGPSDARTGQLEGRVWQIDTGTRMIHVSPRYFGIGATPVVVSDDTVVIVGNREGRFGDLREGLRVRAAWDRRGGLLHARFVHVVDPSLPVDARLPRTGPSPDRARIGPREGGPAQSR